MNAADVTMAWILYWLTLSAVMLTLLVQVVLHPRTRLEWATVAFVGAFALSLLRGLYLQVAGQYLLDEPWRTGVSLTVSLLVLGYLIVLVLEWTTAFRRWWARHRQDSRQ